MLVRLQSWALKAQTSARKSGGFLFPGTVKSLLLKEIWEKKTARPSAVRGFHRQPLQLAPHCKRPTGPFADVRPYFQVGPQWSTERSEGTPVLQQNPEYFQAIPYFSLHYFSSLEMGKQIVVIGGGIMGLCSAYYLHKAGHQVTILDQGDMNAGASYVNAGYLTPSHIIPLASPGMINKGLKWMWNSSSPFYLKPRLDLDFFKWAWYFKKSSTPAKVARAIPVIAAYNLLSKRLFEEILESGDIGKFQLEKVGLLMLCKTETAYKAELAVLQKAIDLGLEAREITESELRKLQPGLKPELGGALHYLCDAHTTPTEIMPLLIDWMSEQGITLHTQTRVTGFEGSDGRIRKVIAETGAFDADEVVMATGAWSPQLGKALGLRIPLQAGKGYRVDVPRPTPVRLPAVLMESKVAVTPMNGFTRLAGTMEFSGINHNIRENRVRAIVAAAGEYYEDFQVEESEIGAAACGLRPVTPDGLPYIGRAGKWKNLCLATGHAMMGWSLGPATGKLVSEIISDEPLSMSLDGLHPERSFR